MLSSQHEFETRERATTVHLRSARGMTMDRLSGHQVFVASGRFSVSAEGTKEKHGLACGLHPERTGTGDLIAFWRSDFDARLPGWIEERRALSLEFDPEPGGLVARGRGQAALATTTNTITVVHSWGRLFPRPYKETRSWSAPWQRSC